jgi:AcrR family transcriptional regulator
MSPAAAPRHTAHERREAIIGAAMIEFAETGLAGTSTETIARRVGISQPYLFRLFGTKKELFLAAVERCFAETMDTFRTAARGATDGKDALRRMGDAYVVLISDRVRLRLQMQAYAACDDPDVRRVVQRGFGELTGLILGISGESGEVISLFIAKGMLLNVLASMDVLDAETGWPQLLRDGCIGLSDPA